MFLGFRWTAGIAGEADALHRVGLFELFSRAERIITVANKDARNGSGVVQEAPVPTLAKVGAADRLDT